MVWRAEDPQGNESGKVRFDLVPYLGRNGIDIGCGEHKVFKHFLGLDNCKDNELFKLDVRPDIRGDCRRMPIFADGSFETVYSAHTLEHIEDYASALREWWRITAPGGHLILYLPHKDLYPNIGHPSANPDHVHDFLPEDIVAAMRAVATGWDLVVNETRDQLREYSFLQVYRKLEGARAGEQQESWRDPKPARMAAVVRPGALGDALWGASVAAEFKAQGYHVTFYTGERGAEVVRHDPHIDRIINLSRLPEDTFDDNDWLLYYLWESRKYQKWANCIGTAETWLLPHPNELAYFWPDKVRHARMNRNYLEAAHEVAEIPFVPRQRFYPSAAELAWAREQRRQVLPGPLVVIAPTGSGGPKTWPHVQRFLEILAERKIYAVVFGDEREGLDWHGIEPYSVVMGKDLPVRLAMTLATTADAVVGTETGLLNAVAQEPMLKVALLSHSSPENLTKHWVNTQALTADGLACHPCHRLHRAFEFCTKDKVTGWAACQAWHSAEKVADLVIAELAGKGLLAGAMAQAA